MKKYEILGGNLPVVVCELSAGEYMITESGSMSWMSPNMKMETISGGGMKKMFGRLMSGDSMFQNRYTAEGADGTIAFASSFPGAIKALDIRDGHSMIVQKSAFLASEEGVELSMHFQKKLGKGMFGGEGFIMQKLSGNGTAFVEIDGHAVEYELDAGQEILISTGYLAAMEETCTMDVVAVKGVKNMLVGGEVMSIIGASGSGKSTMLRCINLLETPSSGQVLYHGQDITAKDFNLIQYRTKVGMVFQSFNLFNNMSALNNCIAGQVSALKRSRKEAEETAMEYLTKVGMAPYINARPSQLSGGQKQRVAIARALAMQPEVLLFDEPTSALDPQMVGEVLDVMRRLAEEGLTMIVVTHEMAFARDVSSDVVYMSDGVICEQGKPHELFENPQNPKTREFLSRFLAR